MSLVKSFLSYLNTPLFLSQQPTHSKAYQELSHVDRLLAKAAEHLMAAEIEQAIECVDKAEKIVERYDTQLGRATILMVRGTIDGARKNREDARTKFTEAFHQYREIDDLLGQANCLYLLGMSYLQSQEYAIAYDMLEEAYTSFVQINVTEGRDRCLFGLVHWLVGNDEDERALTWLPTVLEYAQSAGDILLQAKFYRLAGVLYNTKKEYPAARYYLNKALQTFTDANDTYEEALTLSFLASTCGDEKKFEEADTYYRWCLEVCLKLEKTAAAGGIYFDWAVTYEKRGDFNSAIFLMQRAKETLLQVQAEIVLNKAEKRIQEWRKKLEEKAKPEPEAESKEPDGKETRIE